ncbi:hypothetical protein [Dactylosporangium sp. CA-233914]|uniref:hypothetical protein n=1 Tax=Dactylosporangium sp. CA-233914 TaxID=3239934 RepID=UPI003D8BFA3D
MPNNRYNVRRDGITSVAASGDCCTICTVRHSTNPAVRVEDWVVSSIAARIASTTWASTRPNSAVRLSARWSTRPTTPRAS